MPRPRFDRAVARAYTLLVQITNRANLSLELHEALEGELPDFGTLQQLVLWGARQATPARLLETIALDEYTHDCFATFRDGLVLVLGST
ncbi:MAG: hypothetical protein ACREEM_47295 [Blastocatellia bacterium]